MYNNEISPLSIKELLSEDKYLIPIYQRNYDWGEHEALQLLQDIADFASTQSDKKYYIGSLVVFLRDKDGQEVYETIDGQQRLTTLTILMLVLRGVSELKEAFSWFSSGRLTYDHRPESDNTLRRLYYGDISSKSSDNNIVDVYRIIQKNIKSILSDKDLNIHDFTEYLLSKVIIIRIPVPQDTELNHYFEIMNSRGEQLEKHEVLKACLMDNIDETCHILFNEIWEACSSLSSYVQMNFRPAVRSLIFSESWDKLKFAESDFDELNTKFSNLEHNQHDEADDEEYGYTSRTLSQLFADAAANKKYPLPNSDNNNVGNDRFGSIINFPNLLLHALKIMYHNDCENNADIEQCIKLDDKRLVDIFNMVLARCNDKAAFVKRFIMSLLKIRSLFDKFVIKRENLNGKEAWSLKCVKKYAQSKINYVETFRNDKDDDDAGKDIRMLEAMFHVSAPTQIYKHWLNATLYYVYNQENVDPKAFRDYLYCLACAYMIDRYLCPNSDRIDFEDIIYKHSGQPYNNRIDWQMIDNGCDVENFVFNFYDYITWKSDTTRYNKFDFTYRTSVEHFYPRTPMTGYPELTNETGLNDFGNLCLISRGMNSKFSNNMPVAKYKNFGNEAIAQELSLKLNEMMNVTNEQGEWGETQIKEFEEQARARILAALQECKEVSAL